MDGLLFIGISKPIALIGTSENLSIRSEIRRALHLLSRSIQQTEQLTASE
jgi:hypothetical protein